MLSWRNAIAIFRSRLLKKFSQHGKGENNFFVDKNIFLNKLLHNQQFVSDELSSNRNVEDLK
jgi:hypothetical protein